MINHLRAIYRDTTTVLGLVWLYLAFYSFAQQVFGVLWTG